jgi:hypothetical protein
MKFAKIISLFLFTCTLVCPFTASATAQKGGTEQGGEGFLDAPWIFNVNVYGWLPSAPADITIANEQVASLPESLDTILDSLEMAAMFEVKVHKGPVSVFANTIYYEGDDSENTLDKNGKPIKVNVHEEAWVISYGVGYSLPAWKLGKSADAPTVTLQPYVGGLFMHDPIGVRVEDRITGIGVRVEETVDFNTPVVGLISYWELSDRWAGVISFNYGGFGGAGKGSVDKTYDFIATVGYIFTMWDVESHVYVGYRYLDIELEKRQLGLDVAAKGPFFGIGWVF